MLSKALLIAIFASIPLGGDLEISAAMIPTVSSATDSASVVAEIEGGNVPNCGACEESTCFEICWPFFCDCHWFVDFETPDMSCSGNDGAGCHTGNIEDTCIEAHDVCLAPEASAALDLDELSATIERGDIERIRFLLGAYPEAIAWNESRSALQLKACSGVTVAHFEMEMSLEKISGGAAEVRGPAERR